MKESFLEHSIAFFFKVLLPPFVGVSIKIALKMQKEKMTLVRIILAYVIGIGSAWLASPIIFDAVGVSYAPMILAVVAISGDKIAEYLIYKFNVDGFITVILENAVGSLKKKP